MKLLVMHLSDIHIRDRSDAIFAKKDRMMKAILSEAVGINEAFVVISGDIAFSGAEEEYTVATELLDGIEKDIRKQFSNPPKWVMIPGNHDCNFATEKQKVRDAVIAQVEKTRGPDTELIVQCCEVQEPFDVFAAMYEDADDVVHSDCPLKILRYDFSNHSVVFHCYNTAWMSQKNEQPGRIFFPLDTCKKQLFTPKADVVVGLLHHPLQWHYPDDARILRDHLKQTCDIVLTGHDHLPSKYMTDDLNGNYTEYLEGAVLQDHDDDCSGFHVLLLDLKEQRQKIFTYQWKGGMYSLESAKPDWFPYKRSMSLTAALFTINDSFQDVLNDPGGSFKHPHKSELVLTDFFVFPDLRELLSEPTGQKTLLNDIVSSQDLCKIDPDSNKTLLVGSEKAGKSALCRILFRHYYKKGYVPVYIPGSRLKSPILDDFQKLVLKHFEEQYSSNASEHFAQLEASKKLLIVDDFHRSTLNTKYKARLLKSINKQYPNIIVTANDMFPAEQMLYEETKEEGCFLGYKQFVIMELGHRCRAELIEKWNRLGQEYHIDEYELIRQNDNTKQIIDTVVGFNYVPAYPLFLLILFQSMESSFQYNLAESSYGYYYEFLIIRALMSVRTQHEEIDAYINYLCELANRMFEGRTREWSELELAGFHQWFCDEYALTINLTQWIDRLLSASVLGFRGGVYRFRYNYIYYFFAAKYMANNITQEEIQLRISEMCKRIYREEFANIILFVTHHSKDPFILERVLENARQVFSDLEPVRLEDDITSVNELMDEMPQLVLEDKQVGEARKEVLTSQDRYDLARRQAEDDETRVPDWEEPLLVLDLVAKLNLAFKTIEILGQILRNYYGSLKGPVKLSLCEEAYFIGLRSMNSFFSALEGHTDRVVSEIKRIIDKKKIVDKEKVEEIARKVLFTFCYIISYGFIRKVAGCVGSEKLSQTFGEVVERNPATSFRLVNIAIELDYFVAFPWTSVKTLQKKLSDNTLGETILRRLVINYLYMFPVEYKERQRICDKIGIPMITQRRIEQVSTQKKKEKRGRGVQPG